MFVGIDVGMRNFSYCVVSSDRRVVKWQVLDLVDRFGGRIVKDINLASIALSVQLLCEELFPEPWVRRNVRAVGIEQQPSGRASNVKMVIMSLELRRYFETILYSSTFGDTLAMVDLVAPSLKYCSAWLNRFGETKERKYADRKQLGERLAQKLMSEDFPLDQIPTLRKGQKFDDLADSFLLAYGLWTSWYL